MPDALKRRTAWHTPRNRAAHGVNRKCDEIGITMAELARRGLVRVRPYYYSTCPGRRGRTHGAVRVPCQVWDVGGPETHPVCHAQAP